MNDSCDSWIVKIFIVLFFALAVGSFAVRCDALWGFVVHNNALVARFGVENIFVTFIYSPIKYAEGEVNKVAVWVLENTQQVIARKKIQAKTVILKVIMIF